MLISRKDDAGMLEQEWDAGMLEQEGMPAC